MENVQMKQGDAQIIPQRGNVTRVDTKWTHFDFSELSLFAFDVPSLQSVAVLTVK